MAVASCPWDMPRRVRRSRTRVRICGCQGSFTGRVCQASFTPERGACGNAHLGFRVYDQPPVPRCLPLLLAAAVILGACGSGSSTSSSVTTTTRAAGASHRRQRSPTVTSLAAHAVGELPAPVQFPATAVVGGQMLLMGGLDQATASLADVVRAAPGPSEQIGTLPYAVH